MDVSSDACCTIPVLVGDTSFTPDVAACTDSEGRGNWIAEVRSAGPVGNGITVSIGSVESEDVP